MQNIKVIVAVGKDGAIGYKGGLIWHLPGDLKRFKEITTGHTVIMGRKTWDSLPKKPLPNRRNIILSRQKDYNPEGAEVVSSLEEALDIVKNDTAFIIGGAEIYNLFIPYAGELLLTTVDSITPEADAFLHLNFNDWLLSEAGAWLANDDGVNFRYENYHRK